MPSKAHNHFENRNRIFGKIIWLLHSFFYNFEPERFYKLQPCAKIIELGCSPQVPPRSQGSYLREVRSPGNEVTTSVVGGGIISR